MGVEHTARELTRQNKAQGLRSLGCKITRRIRERVRREIEAKTCGGRGALGVQDHMEGRGKEEDGGSDSKTRVWPLHGTCNHNPNGL